MSDTKFKVGQVVQLRYQKRQKLFILETYIQTCYSNCEQVWYTGRLYTYGYVSEKLAKFSEIELEELPAMTAEVDVLRDKIREAKSEKEAYISKQEFDKAAESRDRERLLRTELTGKLNMEGLTMEDVII